MRRKNDEVLKVRVWSGKGRVGQAFLVLREKRRQVRLLAMCGGWNEVHKLFPVKKQGGVKEKKKRWQRFWKGGKEEGGGGGEKDEGGREGRKGGMFFEGIDGKIHKRIRIFSGGWTGKVDN